MNTKHASYILSILVILVLLTGLVDVMAAQSAAVNDTLPALGTGPAGDQANPQEDPPGVISDGRFTFLEPAYLSEDGKTLHNASLPRVVVVDPNPEMQNQHVPQDPAVAAALADPNRATATFTITFLNAGQKDPWNQTCAAFSESAKTAFNAAAAIWASRVNSTVPITITACWANLGDPDTLGYSGGGNFHRDFDGAPRANTWYQAALANSLAGSDLAPADADMYITYNSAFSWYYGTDGSTPAGQFDLVTVAAHEIAHGLHFAGMMQYSGGTATYGYSGYPSIFETFMESGSGTKLTTYTNPSTALGTLVTSNDLWWNGTHANAANGGTRVKMYAPSTYSPGSSYAHLDYATFATTANNMMVYAVSPGSSQHNPGPVTEGLFKDMGWVLGATTTDPPAAPSGVAASDGTYTDKVRLTWNASTGATKYKVYRNTGSTHTGEAELTNNHSASPYDDTSAVAGTTYTYWVKACNSAGCSDYSSPDTGYRGTTGTIPSPPMGVKASDGTYDDKVRVTWGGFKVYLPLIASSGGGSSFSGRATDLYFKVYRNTGNTHTGETELTSNHPASPYDDTSAVPGVTYHYWVKACNASGCSDYSSADTGYRGGEIPIPDPPTNFSASDGAYPDKVRLTWTASSGATYYKLYRNTSDTHSGETEISNYTESSPFDDSAIAEGTTYTYWVKACNTAACSGYSDPDTGYRGTTETIPAPPTGLAASDGIYPDKVRLTWTASSGATYYKIYRNTSDSHSGETELGENTASPYEDTSAAAGTTYTYWVKACNSADNCSDYSAGDEGFKSSSLPIKNGDFEAGQDGSWTEYSSHTPDPWELVVHQSYTEPPLITHSGEWLAWLGGGDDDISILSQVVTVPASQPYLHFWYYVDSADNICGHDYAYVKIDDIPEETFELCLVNNSTAWTSAVVDLSAYAGSTVGLKFEVNTDNIVDSYSSFFLDDVSFSASSATPAVADPNLNGVFIDLPPVRR